VADPNVDGGLRTPEVQITPYISSNTEAYRADGSHYLAFDDRRQNNPEKIAANTYRFYYVLQMDSLPLDRDRLGHDIPAATSVDVCFQMRAVSVVGTLSEQLQICTKASYAAQPAKLVVLDSQGAELTAATAQVKPGVESVFTIKASVEHSLGVVAVSNPNLLIKALSGTKEISCSYDAADKKNQQTCVIKWTPACVSKTSTVSLAVKADATLGAKTKSNSLSKTLTVVPDLASCPVVKAKGGK